MAEKGTQFRVKHVSLATVTVEEGGIVIPDVPAIRKLTDDLDVCVPKMSNINDLLAHGELLY